MIKEAEYLKGQLLLSDETTSQELSKETSKETSTVRSLLTAHSTTNSPQALAELYDKYESLLKTIDN